MKIKQDKVVFHVYKAIIACQTQLQYAIGKATRYLPKFPNATSTTSGVGLDKTLAVPVITLVLTAEWDQ